MIGDYPDANDILRALTTEDLPPAADFGDDPDAELGGDQGDDEAGAERADEGRTGRLGDTSDSVLADQTARDVLLGHYIYCPGLDWFMWDGKRWAAVDEALVMERVRLYLAKKFGEKVSEAGEDLTEKRLKDLRTLLSAAKVRNVTTLARGIEGIHVEAGQLDAHPDLLNTPSGVVDLRTGELRPHDPALLITKITSGAYRPGYRHRDWDQALEALPPAERDWLRNRLGQAVTGHPTPDGVLVLLEGGGENGKSLLVTDGVVPALGDYAKVASHKLLAGTSEHSEEMASLRGQRLLICEEMAEDRALNITVIKRIMDVGEITARHVHKSNITFRATHSLFATSNYLPIVNETDHGTWRRLARVRFPYTFRKAHEQCTRPTDKPGDARLKTRIRAGRSGQHDAAVTWVVEGAIRWYADPEHALAPTPAIVADTRAWRVEADRVLGFWDARLVADPNSFITATDLFEAFNQWLIGNGHKGWSKELFHPRFRSHSETTKHGVERRRPKTLKGLSRSALNPFDTKLPQRPEVYVGVRFRDDDDPLPGDEGAYEQSEHAGDRGDRPEMKINPFHAEREKVLDGSVPSVPPPGSSENTLPRIGTCRVCRQPMKVVETGQTTHPGCDPEGLF